MSNTVGLNDVGIRQPPRRRLHARESCEIARGAASPRARVVLGRAGNRCSFRSGLVADRQPPQILHKFIVLPGLTLSESRCDS